MSINSNITFVPDTTAVDAATDRIKKEHKEIKKSTTEQINQIRYMWGYLNQLTTISIGIIKRVAKGTKLAAGAQKVAAGIQIVQTQVAVAHFLMMGAAYSAAGNWFAAGAVFAIAAAMEASMGVQLANEARARENERYAAGMVAAMEAYSL
jgi:hypothetical protein